MLTLVIKILTRPKHYIFIPTIVKSFNVKYGSNAQFFKCQNNLFAQMLPKSYFGNAVFEPDPEPRKIEFQIYGVITSKEFQLSKCYIETLFSRIPKEYAEPYINPMLNVDWTLFLTKIRRESGGEKLWSLKKQVVIFKNNKLLGDDEDLLYFVGHRYKLALVKEFEEFGTKQLIGYIKQQQDFGNKFVFFTIAVENNVIGTMLFEIYAVTVPHISKLFIKRCQKIIGGYTGTSIQRIVLPSWIQCGGWHLNHYKVTCENYITPHNRRGVLSMCNHGKHFDNYTQFLITLEPTPWMDYKYVAFGQLIHGEEILFHVQNIPTCYEEPTKKINIVKCGEFDLCPTFKVEDLNTLETFLSKRDPKTLLHFDVVDVRDTPSTMLAENFQKWKYSAVTDKRSSAVTDKRSYRPSNHLPDQLAVNYIKHKHDQELKTDEAKNANEKSVEGLPPYCTCVSKCYPN